MNIAISVADKVATVTTENAKLYCGNSDQTITWTFDAEWDNLSPKYAVYVYRDRGRVTNQVVAFTGNTSTVPVLANITSVEIGVYSGELHSTTPAIVDCVKSILCDARIDVDDVLDPLVDTDSIIILERDENGHPTKMDLTKAFTTEIPAYLFYSSNSAGWFSYYLTDVILPTNLKIISSAGKHRGRFFVLTGNTGDGSLC